MLAAVARSLLLVVAAFLGIAVHIPDVKAQGLTFSAGAEPKLQLQPNAAYGTLRFNLQLFENGKPSKRSVYDALLNGLQNVPFLNCNGEFIVTLEVLSPTDEVLARRALVQAKRESSGWFIFNRVEKTSQATEWYGDLQVSTLIRPDTNNIRIRMRALFTQQTKVDLATFNLLLGILEKSKALGVANTAIDAVWKPIATQIEALLSSYEQSDVSDIATLSFLRFNEQAHAASGAFIREYRDESVEPSRKVKVQVTVSTEPVTTRVVLVNKASGKVDPAPSYGDVLAAAIVGGQPIETVLLASKTEAVKKFLTDLSSSSGYTADDIGEKCDSTYSELAKYFTVTDKAATYWALLNAHRRKLSANRNAKDCLSSTVRQQITTLGLGFDDLPFSKGIVVADGNLESFERVKKIIANQPLLERILKDKDTVRTYQSFPIRRVTD